MKKVAIMILTVMVLCGVALWYLADGSLNEVIKQQIQIKGQAATGQSVTVKAVDIKLAQGAGAINNLAVANPEGFKDPNILSFDKISLDIDLSNYGTPFIVESIEVIGLQAFVEIKEDGSSNIQTLYDYIKQQSSQQQADKNTAPKQEKTDKLDPQIRVNKLVIAGSMLSLDLTQLGNKTHKVTLPAVDLGNIGGTDGLPASQLGSEIA